MSRAAMTALMLWGCTPRTAPSGAGIEDATVATVRANEPPAKPAAPPPPPVPRPGAPQPPPAAVRAFLEAHRQGDGPWTVRQVVGGRRTTLGARDAAELARRLGDDGSYVDGEHGCGGHPVEYELARDGARLTFREDCGNVRIGRDRVATFSSDMVAFVRGLRGEAVPR